MALIRESEIVQLTTTGARSGQPRTVEMTAHEYGDALYMIGSNWGRPRHPSWYHNLRANPAATVLVGGRPLAMTARVADGAERDRLLAAGKQRWSGYTDYELKSGRRLPVIVFESAADPG
jgi:deazaflavin-dependent oxidoreductase (nitroreductase family)